MGTRGHVKSFNNPGMWVGDPFSGLRSPFLPAFYTYDKITKLQQHKIRFIIRIT